MQGRLAFLRLHASLQGRPRAPRRHREFRPSILSFHTSRRLRADASDDGTSHYEILDIPENASPEAIKTQFYRLSKSSHPDLNPGDPSASQRFARISTAYATLGSPAKRASYDRDLARTRPASSFSPAPSGSYSSAQAAAAAAGGGGAAGGPFGARPASGLSKRRGTFRGPPPSFYASGGYGFSGRKRRAASAGTASAAAGVGADAGNSAENDPYANADPDADAHPDYTGAGSSSGYGPGQGFAGADVPHFDRAVHTRKHETQQHRMRQRRRVVEDQAYMQREEAHHDTMTRFILVTTIVLIISIPFYARGAG